MRVGVGQIDKEEKGNQVQVPDRSELWKYVERSVNSKELSVAGELGMKWESIEQEAA